MLNGGYWEQFKIFYDTHKHYINIVIEEKVLSYINEIINGDASFLHQDTPYNYETIEDWVLDTEGLIDDENEINSTKTISKFPGIYNYYDNAEVIASYFFNRDIELFKNKIIDGDKEFIDEAIRLEWTEMLAFNPLLKDIFYF